MTFSPAKSSVDEAIWVISTVGPVSPYVGGSSQRSPRGGFESVYGGLTAVLGPALVGTERGAQGVPEPWLGLTDELRERIGWICGICSGKAHGVPRSLTL